MILRQLESQKENIDQQRIIVQQILSKFPTDVIVKLEESKRLNESWTVARDEPILLLFSPIFLSGNSFIFSLLCSIFCSKLNIILKV